MQILIVSLLIILLVGFIIYKVNGQFAKKEALILLAVVIISALAFTMYQKNQQIRLPNAFKAEYQKQNNIEILKLSSELLNNKNISSKTHFIYKFTYIINKKGNEYLCVTNNVDIKKIEDEFIFSKWTEACQKR